MTLAKPIARPLLVGLLILAALLVYAAMSSRVALAPSLPSIAFPQQTQTESRSNTGTGQGQSTQATQSYQTSQSSADTVQKPSGSGAPVDGAGRSGIGVQRFADAGPDVVGPAAAQTVQSCGPKPCPRPQR